MDELVAKLGLDWRLLLAQVVNFAILLAILSWAVYRPLLKVMNERRTRIAGGLATAAAASRQLQEFAAYQQQQLAEFRQQADAMLAEATQLAALTKKEAVRQATEQAATIVAQAKLTIAAERERMLQELRGQLADLVVVAAGKVVAGRVTPQQHTAFVEAAVAALKS